MSTQKASGSEPTSGTNAPNAQEQYAALVAAVRNIADQAEFHLHRGTVVVINVIEQLRQVIAGVTVPSDAAELRAGIAETRANAVEREFAEAQEAFEAYRASWNLATEATVAEVRKLRGQHDALTTAVSNLADDCAESGNAVVDGAVADAYRYVAVRLRQAIVGTTPTATPTPVLAVDTTVLLVDGMTHPWRVATWDVRDEDGEPVAVVRLRPLNALPAGSSTVTHQPTHPDGETQSAQDQALAGKLAGVLGELVKVVHPGAGFVSWETLIFDVKALVAERDAAIQARDEALRQRDEADTELDRLTDATSSLAEEDEKVVDTAIRVMRERAEWGVEMRNARDEAQRLLTIEQTQNAADLSMARDRSSGYLAEMNRLRDALGTALGHDPETLGYGTDQLLYEVEQLRNEVRLRITERDKARRESADTIAALRKAGDEQGAEIRWLQEQLTRLKGERILSVVFGHHKGAPRPFALYRPGRVLAALGAEFPDGAVALRLANDGGWTTKSQGGAGQFADTEVVWLSDEIEALAIQEQREEALRAGLHHLADEMANREARRLDPYASRLRALATSSTTPAGVVSSATAESIALVSGGHVQNQPFAVPLTDGDLDPHEGGGVE